MISKLQLLRNVGTFDSVNSGANIPLARLTVIYAENARGKTTLGAILRSLASGDPTPIIERHRLSAEHPPHIVLEFDSDPQTIIFENSAWNHKFSNIVIFDDVFVDQNVCSGLSNEAGHRQNLHEWILGAAGVQLEQMLKKFVSKIEVHISELRSKANAIPVGELHGFSVDAFCVLPSRPDIDMEIQATERQLQAAREQETIRNTPLFDTLSLPGIDLIAIEGLLRSNLATVDAAAVTRIQSHLAELGEGSEIWVGEGMEFVTRISTDTGPPICPFCAQDLIGSPLIDHYRAYFSDEYNNLKREISEVLRDFNQTHRGEVGAAFERSVRVMGERTQIWGRFFDIPSLSIDTAAIAQDWQAARESIDALLTAKQSAPLEQIRLTDEVRTAVTKFEAHRVVLTGLNSQLVQANLEIPVVKEQAVEGNPALIQIDLEQRRAVKARHSPSISGLCEAYLAEKEAKAQTEQLRDAARVDLDQYRTSVFPGYQTSINEYLRRFNAGFRVTKMDPTNTRGGSACTYSAIIDNESVQISGGEPSAGMPSFRNTLSSGDRNTLALAFFFASLDQDPDMATKIVVIDDPITSLDQHRSLTTVQETRRLADKTEQVIVMSHSKAFLCPIWEGADRTLRSALQITRNGDASTLSAWNVNDDIITEHDRRHALLREYAANGGPNNREVAVAIRPLLEAYLRVVCPKEFPPETLLGPFRDLCRQRVGSTDEIMNAGAVQELQDLTEYANKFHHDANAAWETEIINDGELRDFVLRALAFTSPLPHVGHL